MLRVNVFQELKEVAMMMSCEDLDEVKQWYLYDRQVLEQGVAGEYLAKMAELKMDSIQISAFFVSI